jgi:twinkle protein
MLVAQVLVELGPDELRYAIDAAELYPIRGLFTFSDFFKDLDNYFCSIDGDETGVSTGWPSLDDYYKVGKLCDFLGIYIRYLLHSG